MYEFASHPSCLCLAPVYRTSLWCLSSPFTPPSDEYLPDPLTNWPFHEAHPLQYLLLSTHPSNVVFQWTDGLAWTGEPFPLHYLPICTHQCQKTQQSRHKQSCVWLTPCRLALEIFAALGLVCFFPPDNTGMTVNEVWHSPNLWRSVRLIFVWPMENNRMQLRERGWTPGPHAWLGNVPLNV